MENIIVLNACFLNTTNDFFKICSMSVVIDPVKKIVFLKRKREYLLSENKSSFEKQLTN